MSVGAQMVVLLKAVVEHCVSLVLGHPFDFPGSRYPKQMYFLVLLRWRKGRPLKRVLGLSRAFSAARPPQIFCYRFK